MTVFQWLSDNWPSLLQNVGIIGGLGFTAYSTWKDERARRIGNSIAISGQYRDIWSQVFQQPDLVRVLEPVVDLDKNPPTMREEMFVNQIIVHLDTILRAMESGVFVRMDGLKNDVRDFFSLPIPRAVFDKNKAFQDDTFTKFVESCLAASDARAFHIPTDK